MDPTGTPTPPPEALEAPGTLETPEATDLPLAPELPEPPDTPEATGTPEALDTPAAPDTADTPKPREPTETPVVVPTMWHLYWQAAYGRKFFDADDTALHDRIRDRLIDAHKREGRILVDYTLLPTEIHVVAEIPPGDTAGSVARAVGNVVARWVRATATMRSPVLAGPYRASAILSATDQQMQIRMMAWRPVFLGLCATPAHHPNATYRVALGLSSGGGFDAAPLLRVFGLSVSLARKALRAAVTQRPTEQQRKAWELLRGLALATDSGGANMPASSRELRRAAAAALVAAGNDWSKGSGSKNSIDGALAILETWVAAKLGLTAPRALHTNSSAVGARGRGLVACLADESGLCSAATVARYFGRAKATISEQMAARRASTVDRQIMATPAQRIIEEAVALRAERARLAAAAK
jgi:hypothetical protein